jgi:hypothetical protein
MPLLNNKKTPPAYRCGEQTEDSTAASKHGARLAAYATWRRTQGIDSIDQSLPAPARQIRALRLAIHW